MRFRGKRRGMTMGICVIGIGAGLLCIQFLPATALLVAQTILIIIVGILLCKR